MIADDAVVSCVRKPRGVDADMVAAFIRCDFRVAAAARASVMKKDDDDAAEQAAGTAAEV